MGSVPIVKKNQPYYFFPDEPQLLATWLASEHLERSCNWQQRLGIDSHSIFGRLHFVVDSCFA